MTESLNEKLKKLRLKSGLTQAQLAEKVRVSPSCIGMYEQGRREPNNKVLSRICRELNATGNYILNLEKEDAKSRDVYIMLEEFTQYIESEEDIMLNGRPIPEEDKRKISSALRVATAVALSDNRGKK